jgi:pyruvate ferredoxin oxidoreductase beta subunit
MKNNYKLLPGHSACAGCGQLSAVQSVMRALSDETIIVNATGCLEVTTSKFPESAWNLSWLHSLFANTSSVASGIKAALKSQKNQKTKVVVQAGDGGTYDIGMGQISGMWERNDHVLYICYDTEAYSNTGIQASSSTSYGANTTTTPAGQESIGSKSHKKDMIGIALAHGLKYVAQSVTGFPDDIENKVKKALKIKGSTYIQILSPCIPGWKIKSDEAAYVGKLAVETGLYPLLEYIDGKLIKSSIDKNFQLKAVDKYLDVQKRFKHLKEKDKEVIKILAKENIEKYKL